MKAEEYKRMVIVAMTKTITELAITKQLKGSGYTPRFLSTFMEQPFDVLHNQVALWTEHFIKKHPAYEGEELFSLQIADYVVYRAFAPVFVALAVMKDPTSTSVYWVPVDDEDAFKARHKGVSVKHYIVNKQWEEDGCSVSREVCTFTSDSRRSAIEYTSFKNLNPY